MRRMASEFQGQFMDAMREADIEDIRKEVAKVGEAAKVDVNFDPVSTMRNEIGGAIEGTSSQAPAVTAAESSAPLNVINMPDLPEEAPAATEQTIAAAIAPVTPEAAQAELAHLGPEANEVSAEQLGEILAGESRRLHSLLRDQRVIAGIGRAWANEILHAAKLSPYALSKEVKLHEVERLHDAIQSELARGLELRERGANDKRTYRVHTKLAEPCFVCGAPIAQVDFEEHTIYYCPQCQTGGRVLKDRRLSRLLR